MRLIIYVRAATAWALSASDSNDAGISAATTPGSHSSIVVSTTSPESSAVKLMSASSPAYDSPPGTDGSALPASGGETSSKVTDSARARHASPAANTALMTHPLFLLT